MTSSIVATDSVLTLEIGSTKTRAALFDVVGGFYRFIAAGTAATTIGPPYNDAREGALQAIQQLQETTGRTLIASDGSLLIPATPDGSGVDAVAATMSAGPPIRVVAVGLLDDVSLQSAVRLAQSTYTTVVEKVSMSDGRQQARRIDAILHARPEWIIFAGGLDGGATHSIHALAEVVGLASYLLPRNDRPVVLYAGNSEIRQEIKEALAPVVDVYTAPNIRPALQEEHLHAAGPAMRKVFKAIRSAQMFGLSEIDGWSEGRLLPTATAFGRMIRFLGRLYDPNKAVLGIDVGSASVTVAAASGGHLTQRVFSDLGMGESVDGLLNTVPPQRIARWLPNTFDEDHVLNFVANKAAFPASVPVSTEELLLEQAVGREVVAAAVRQTLKEHTLETGRARPDVLPWTEPILLSGALFSRSPSVAQAMLLALDGLQPAGVTTVVLDQNELLPSLGVAAEVNPLLAVQVLESHAFLNLGTVIAPVGHARQGTPVLRLNVHFEDGRETRAEIKFGSLVRIPLPAGKSAQVHVQPLHRFDVGLGGPGRGGRLQVAGGALGIVVDARGRPLQLPKDATQRSRLLERWSTALTK